jgi:hypothetical protein
LITIMKKLIGHYGERLTLIWAYEKGDDEILDRGQDLSEVVKFNFQFKEMDA